MQPIQAIENSIRALEEHQQKILRELRQRIDAESSSRNPEDAVFEIVTALVPRAQVEDMSRCGFFEITLGEESIVAPKPIESDIRAPLFLRGSYSDFNVACSKTFRGRSFDYRLTPLRSFIDRAEGILFRLAQIYDVSRPLVFSPYARRAVCINILEQSDVERITLDQLCLEQNGLDGVLLVDRALMWNARVDPIRDMLGYNAVDTAHHIYFYDNVAENQFILPVQSEPRIESFLRSSDDALELVCDRKFDDESYRKISVVKPVLEDVPEGVEIFSNACDVPRLFKKSHIRTVADINYILTALSQKNFSARFEPESVKPPLPTYEPHHRYHSHSEEAFNRSLRRRSVPGIAVEFQGAEPFVADYAAFVLQWIETNFPEYHWKGVH